MFPEFRFSFDKQFFDPVHCDILLIERFISVRFHNRKEECGIYKVVQQTFGHESLQSFSSKIVSMELFLVKHLNRYNITILCSENYSSGSKKKKKFL
jgi:hypothetical protein